MFSLDAITNKGNKDDDKNWPYRMLIMGPSGLAKTNALLNLIQKQNKNNPIDKIYLYAKGKNVRMQEERIITIRLRLLNIQILWMMFLATFMTTIQK